MALSEHIHSFLVDLLSDVFVELLPCDFFLAETSYVIDYFFDLLVVEVVFQLVGYAL